MAFEQSPTPVEPSRPAEPLEGDRRSSPLPGWPWWTAGAAILFALVLTAVGAVVVDLPAQALGVEVSGSHVPAGLTIADTFVQDLAFVVGSVYAAKLGGRVVRSWQFGLRRPGSGWRSAGWLIVLLLLVFILLNAVWAEFVHPEKEKLLNDLGTNKGTGLLLLSAALTCVIAPMCEEFLFRGCIFTSLRSWGTLPAALVTGLIFGAVHATSAPAEDLLPLAALGFGLCLLYRYSGSLYPSMAAHSLNNSIAFAGLEHWGWQAPVLMVAALAGIALVVAGVKRVGLIAPEGRTLPPGGVGSSP
jgi:membrane protease YdiL (CAAX protease family)